MSENDLPSICGRCWKININSQWFEPESHTDYYGIRRKLEDVGKYCPECTEFLKKEHERLKKEYLLLRN